MTPWIIGMGIRSRLGTRRMRRDAMLAADATPFLHELRYIPSLVVSARHDRIAPPHAGRALAASLPGSKYFEIADGAHAVTIQLADQVNSVLLDFLQRAESPS